MESFEKVFVREWQGGSSPGAPCLVFHELVDSTSSDLGRRLENGAPLETVVAANDQSGGRGRSGRKWYSQPGGNLYVSAAIDVGVAPEKKLPFVPLLAGIAAVDSIAECGPLRPKLKWPNDLLVEGKKLAGILCELPHPKRWPGTVIVGFGVNISVGGFPEEIADTATSMSTCVASKGGQEVHPAKIAALFVDRLRQWVVRGLASRGGVIDEWKQRAEPFGRRVRVQNLEGRTVDLTEEGHLLLELEDGSLARVSGGIVENLGENE